MTLRLDWHRRRLVERAARLRARVLRVLGLAYFALVPGPHGGGRPQSAGLWDVQWRRGDWAFLGALEELPRYAVIAGLIRSVSAAPAVLDLGCGHGQLWTLLGSGAVSSYLGIDISREAIAQARRRSTEPARFEAADLATWVPARRVDVVVFNEVLYYLPDPVAVVERYLGQLSEDGIAIISMFRHRTAPGIWRDLQRRYALRDVAKVENRLGELIEIRIVQRPRSSSGTASCRRSEAAEGARR